MKLSECTYLGTITQAGSDGQISIRVDSDNIPENKEKLESVLVRMNKSDLELVPFFLKKIPGRKTNNLQFSLDPEVHFPDEALELKGKQVFFPFKNVGNNKTGIEPEALVGFTVSDLNLGIIGKVEDFYHSSAHPILSIINSNGNEILIPFVEEIIAGIDAENKTISINAPEGLLGLNVS